MKISFIVKSRNKAHEKLCSLIEERCHKLGFLNVEIAKTLREKHAIELAKMATENNFDYIIAVGGDGTLHEVLNGILQSKVKKTEYPTLGLLPCGSANDFAKNIGATSSIDDLLNLIVNNSIIRIDIGKVLLTNEHKVHYFINIVSIGLGAEIVQGLANSNNLWGAKLKYAIHIIKGFLKYSKKQLKCTSKLWDWDGKLQQIAVGNGRYHGNGICSTPDAKLNDGLFQVTIFGDLSIWDYLKNLRKLKSGNKLSHKEVFYHDTSELLIESSDVCGLEADGEYLGLCPARITVMPQAIRFLIVYEKCVVN